MGTIIYLRTSTEQQNPINQKADCLSIMKQAWGTPKIILEQQSAWKDKDRPLFESIKKEIAQKKVKHLICWDLDRLFRDRKKLIEFFAFCKIYKCEIESFRQQWLNELNNIQEPFNEIMFNLMLQIMGWLAEEEAKKKSERVKIAFKNSKKKWGRKPISDKIEERVLELHKIGKTMREISKEVYYWDSARNKKFVSKSAVHKIIDKSQSSLS